LCTNTDGTRGAAPVGRVKSADSKRDWGGATKLGALIGNHGTYHQDRVGGEGGGDKKTGLGQRKTGNRTISLEGLGVGRKEDKTGRMKDISASSDVKWVQGKERDNYGR